MLAPFLNSWSDWNFWVTQIFKRNENCVEHYYEDIIKKGQSQDVTYFSIATKMLLLKHLFLEHHLSDTGLLKWKPVKLSEKIDAFEDRS